jgi:hypothetical protein
MPCGTNGLLKQVRTIVVTHGTQKFRRCRLVEFSRIVLPPFMAVSDAFASPPVPGF